MINLNKHRIDFGKGDVGIGAVSYTHLDVYKRQEHTKEPKSLKERFSRNPLFHSENYFY